MIIWGTTTGRRTNDENSQKIFGRSHLTLNDVLSMCAWLGRVTSRDPIYTWWRWLLIPTYAFSEKCWPHHIWKTIDVFLRRSSVISTMDFAGFCYCHKLLLVSATISTSSNTNKTKTPWSSPLPPFSHPSSPPLRHLHLLPLVQGLSWLALPPSVILSPHLLSPTPHLSLPHVNLPKWICLAETRVRVSTRRQQLMEILLPRKLGLCLSSGMQLLLLVIQGLWPAGTPKWVEFVVCGILTSLYTLTELYWFPC